MAITQLHENQATERLVCDYVFEFTPDIPTAQSGVEEVLLNLPTGSIITDVYVQTVQAEVSATSSLLSISVAPTAGAAVSTLALFVGSADNGGAIGTDTGTLTPRPTTADAASGAVPWTVFTDFTSVGTATVQPIYRVTLRAFRPDYTL